MEMLKLILSLCFLVSACHTENKNIDFNANVEKLRVFHGQTMFHIRSISPADMKSYLKQLAENNSQIAEYIVTGYSFEGEELGLLRVSSDLSVKKPAIYIDGGVHGREFDSVSTLLYIIHQFLEVQENRYLMDDVEWHLYPLVNPDGFTCAKQDTIPRWRKTTSKGVLGDGVDLDRNFDINWGMDGDSPAESQDLYRGPKPFSEKEGIAIRDYILDNAHIKVYISFRSFAAKIHYPYKYKETAPDNVETLESLAQSFANTVFAIRKTQYKVGSGIDLFYKASGVIADWVMEVAKVPLVFTIELAGTSFVTPPEEAFSLAAESFEGLKVFHQHVQSAHSSATSWSSAWIYWLVGMLFIAASAIIAIGVLYYFKRDLFNKIFRRQESFV